MEDGLVLMYVHEGVIYPVVLSQNQYDKLQLMAKVIIGDGKLTIMGKHPLGKAINLLKED